MNFSGYGNPQDLVDQYLPPNSGGDLGCITFSTPGEFTYDCSIGSHAANGMIATISVVEYLEPLGDSSVSITDCGDFEEGNNSAWAHILTATTAADGVSSQEAQTFTMNVTSLPEGGANVRVYKTTANGSDFFGNAVALTLGSNSITVSAVGFDRTVKFQFSSGDIEFNSLSVNGVDAGCIVTEEADDSSVAITDCGDFEEGNNSAWAHILTATTAADGASSQEAQTFTMNVTSLPEGGANVRVYKTTANGSDFFGNAVALTLGSNSITVSAVGFDRTVKFQFSSGDIEFNSLSVNGVDAGCIVTEEVDDSSVAITDCGDFEEGNNSAWAHILTATTAADGASSQEAQTFTMNVTSLPEGGANVRVYKTTANGSDFFGNAVALTLGSNSITVSAVGFDRTVKFQFSSGDIEFNSLSVNGVDAGCIVTEEVDDSSVAITDCGDFEEGNNSAWAHILTATTAADGASSQEAQTFTMNVTSLPEGGANVRVYKTTANGSDFFGNAVALTLGSNSITVSAVGFDRTVKFQFSSGDIEFNSLSVNGVDAGCLSPEAGFYPPEGSVFNSDSSVVTLPEASTESDYNESISFYATEEISIPDVGSFGFVSANITSVSTPAGMSYSCDPEGCNFGPNAWGYVTLTGTPESAGSYNLDLSAMVTVNLASVGLDADLSFPIPYNGENPILNTVLGTDYSALNSFVPTFTLNVSGDVIDVSGCTDPSAENYNSNATSDDGSCQYPSMVDGVRYVDEIFTSVNVEQNVVYGANIGILTQAPVLEDLTMDVYTPEGDDVTDRPVIVLLHTGTFLPAIVNGQATGDKSDNTLVELCTRLAKKGYVAVSANYRLGWNPLSTDPEVRTSTLAQAFYRAQQDARTAVRYLRMTAAEMGNPYGIGDKFAVGGDGTGGYMALALASLDKDSEVLLPKFIDSSDNAIATYGQPVPYIIQSMLGNLGGSNYGSTMMDLDGDGTPETEVPLCVPNHPDYSDAIDMAFNFGGAMLDTVWIEAGEAPIASFQNTNDQFAPYNVDVLTEPVNNDPVIEAHGSLPVIRRATALGNNDCFAGLSTTLVDATYGNGDGAANAAAAGHADMPGLFPLVTPTPSATPTACGMAEWDGAPWQWWDNATYDMMAGAYQGQPAGVMGCLALLSNPDMSEEKGMAFTDMLEEFFTPRIARALDLEPKRYVDEIFTSVNVESNVVYGANIGILTQAPVLEDLTMDVYTPEGDEATDRRVVVLLHTGTFLPAIVNGQATGDKSDNTLVELCTRLAKKGYVAVSANYRLGWNPLSTDPEVRTSTLAQAFYRAQQDARTAVRYLRMTAAEMGNPYGIGDKFAVGGDGTGGYMALALASLDKDSEVLLPKFIDSSDNAIATYGQPVPYIIQSMLGNLGGSNYGSTMMDLDGDGTPETEVPLCVPNHPDYSDAIDMAFNFGGAMLDTVWIEAGEAPIASFQNTNDQFAPYNVDVLTEPVNNDPVIEAHGSLPVIRRATALGNNDCFAGLSTTLVDATYGNGDGAANAAAAGHADMPGLFPLVTPTPSATPTACGMAEWDGAPWQWWDNATYDMMAGAYQGQPAGVMGCLALLSNPDMSEEKGMAFTDMLEEFFTPRIDAALSMDNSSQDNGPDEQVLDLPAGWSMFSTYMLADDMALDAILNPILSNVIIAKDYLGSAYLPEFNFNGVGDLTVGWGYQIKTAEASSLTVVWNIYDS